MADNKIKTDFNELEDLLSDSSRKTADIAVNLVGSDSGIYKRFIDFALEDRGKYAMRAARVINLVSLKHPHLIRPYLPMLVHKLPNLKNDGLKRGIAKTISERSPDYDDETTGLLVNTCFDWLNDPQEKIALKVYAMEILYRISQFYPEMKPELIASIEHQLPEASTAIKSRGRKYLLKLYKETGQSSGRQV